MGSKEASLLDLEQELVQIEGYLAYLTRKFENCPYSQKDEDKEMYFLSRRLEIETQIWSLTEAVSMSGA